MPNMFTCLYQSMIPVIRVIVWADDEKGKILEQCRTSTGGVDRRSERKGANEIET
jgi:hypothetical protein